MPTEPSVVVTLRARHLGTVRLMGAPNSALCRRLTETWGERIALMPLRWSGGNTVRARARAAADLATHIDAVARRFPAANHYVIAHSHGGNVALYALRQRSSVRISGLACLSTPFLHVRNRNLGQVSISSISAGMFISALIVVQTLLERQFAWTEDGALLAGLSTAAVLTALFHVGSQRLAGPTLAACSLPTSIDTDLLLIRTTGDEASSALAAAHFASWLAKRLWNFLRPCCARDTNLFKRGGDPPLEYEWLSDTGCGLRGRRAVDGTGSGSTVAGRWPIPFSGWQRLAFLCGCRAWPSYG